MRGEQGNPGGLPGGGSRRGSGRVTGWGRQNHRTMGEGHRVIMGGENVLSPYYRRNICVPVPKACWNPNPQCDPIRRQAFG